MVISRSVILRIKNISDTHFKLSIVLSKFLPFMR